MLVAEPLFLKLISTVPTSQNDTDNTGPIKQNLLLYLDTMSKVHMTSWDEIVKQAGACCWEYFLLDPESYMKMLNRGTRTSQSSGIELTDFEMISKLKLGLTFEFDRSLSRKDLIRISLELLNQESNNNHELKASQCPVVQFT